MWLSSLFASLHYLAFGIGLTAVFMRGRYFKALSENAEDILARKNVLMADNFWGVAALLWLSTGLMRAFGGLEKGTHWYLQNPMFHLKMGLFILIFLLELRPMILLVRARTKKIWPNADQFRTLRKINHWEAVITGIILFVASAMARGLGF